jgi:signal transduction histidine kinase
MNNLACTRELVALDGRPQVREFLGHPAEHSHIVQFYEAESSLVENVVEFLAAGIRAGEPVVVIASPEHRAAFVEGLVQRGVEFARHDHDVVMLDARDTLATFMDRDMPDWQRFNNMVGAVIQRLLSRTVAPRVRAYGEMVDLLWRDGHRPAAIRLEEYWNDLGTSLSFSLLCAYVMGNFVKSGDTAAFREVCKTHSHVIPAEGYLDANGGNERLRVISELQQRARALESEIEHRKELELALRESLAREQALRKEAERSVHYSDVFAGMLGHDLRNPLGTIMMGANYIARASLSEKPTKAATRIVTSAERMGRMIDQLLDFARIRAAGGLELQRTRVELAEICERVKEEIEAGHPQCSIQLKTDGNTDGLWDRDRLLQVFSNLVGNAVTHGTAGCEVSVEADGQDMSNVVVYVRNAGGVEPEVLPVMFDPFRGGKKRHNTKGLGLGLFITRQIVLGHGGEIAVTSSDEQGTLICVKLPRFPRRSLQNDTIQV